MLRTLFLLIALLVLIVIGLIATGYLNLNREADGSLSIKTGDVNVGTTTTNVQVPAVRMENRQVEVPSVTVESGDQSNSQ